MPEPRPSLDQAQQAMAGLESRPVREHLAILSGALDAVVDELDQLSRSVPTVR